MHIFIKKFGTTLVSRPTGKEAYLAFRSTLNTMSDAEKIILDFEGVKVLTPSWMDEFVTPFLQKYKGRVTLKNTENASVQAVLKVLNLKL